MKAMKKGTPEFFLEQRVLGARVILAIDKGRYQQIRHARSLLSAALDFEQQYDLVLGNFMEMELAMTELCLRTTLRFDFSYTTSADNIREANRHVVNVLTAIRSYIDQVPQQFKMLQLSPTFKELVKLECTAAYDRSPSYAFIYYLRNYVQHRANAIDRFESSSMVDRDVNAWAERIRFLATKAVLEAGEFGKKGLAGQPAVIDVRKNARRAVEEIGQIHHNLRKAVQPQISDARATMDSAIADYLSAGATSAVGLCASGTSVDDIPVLIDWDDVRKTLADRNRIPARIADPPSHREPTAADIRQLREAVGQTATQAAALACVSELRWHDYEAGFAVMPEGLFHLYQLQVGRHPKCKLVLNESPHPNEDDSPH